MSDAELVAHLRHDGWKAPLYEGDWRALRETIDAAAARIEELLAERDDLRTSVISFGAPWAVKHAMDFGLPRGTLYAVHYDILARAGARMDDFTRAAVLPAPPAVAS